MDFDVTGVSRVAERLDSLADRLEDLLRQTTPALTVVPAAADEVSARAAGTLNEVAHGHRTTCAAGTYELRKLAANLRCHAGAIDATDRASAMSFWQR
ncbi:PE family protein [Nocardia alni]|uniref:PE family protein n=1 Tax=Nocardia alni TaxID=2815723 RepID=UPI001C238EC9|nr:PE family protein [Nocardia alni]